jgi:hypothetical protein
MMRLVTIIMTAIKEEEEQVGVDHNTYRED